MTVFEVFTQAVAKVKGAPVCTIFEAIAAVQDVIVSHLLMRKSDLLISEWDAVLKFAVGKPKMMLPEEFLQLADRPCLPNGQKLVPLQGRGVVVMTPATPQFYRIRGQWLSVYPVPAEATQVSVPFFYRPEKPTKMNDDLPFWGMFDSAFVDAVVPVLTLGVGAVAETGFAATIQAQVDGVLQAQSLADEQLLADSINGL